MKPLLSRSLVRQENRTPSGISQEGWVLSAIGLSSRVISKQQRTRQDFFPLPQLRVLRFGFFQDGDVGVGVFPEGEEVFVGSEHPDAGGIGIRSLRHRLITHGLGA